MAETSFLPIDDGIMYIAGKPYWCKGLVQRRKVSQTPPPQRTGDIVRSDQQIASEVTWEDLTGGLGVLNMDERETPDRFTDAEAGTMVKSYWTLPAKVHTITMPNVGPIGVSQGELTNIGGAVTHKGYTYLGFGSFPIRISNPNSPIAEFYNASASVWTTVTAGATAYTAQGPITGDPVVWLDDVWFPAGLESSGGLLRYDVATQAFNTITNADGGGAIRAVKLEVFDEDLYILTADGTVYSAAVNATSLVLTTRGRVSSFAHLNGLTVHRNLSGDPAPWIGTESRLLVHDYDQTKVRQSGIKFPDGDPDNAKGFAVWEGDLYFGKGANINQLTSGAKIVRGPNTGDGLLKEMQGRVVDIDPSMDNYLIYAIAGGQTYHTSSIMAYNKKGHHVLAKSNPTVAAASTDPFTRADSAVTMDGGGKDWDPASGTWGIASNTAYCAVSAGTSNRAVTLSTDIGSNFVGPNQRVQVTFSTNTTGTQLVFRAEGTEYHAVEKYASGYQLVEYVASVKTVLQKIPMSTANGDVIRVDAYNSMVAVYVNGSVVFQGAIDYHPRAWAGIGTDSQTTARFDDFSMQSLSEAVHFVHYMASGVPDQPGILLFNGGDNNTYQATQLQYIKLFDLTDNPNQYISTDYASTGYVILPRFDANLAEVQKTGLNVQVRTLDCSATETVIVYYALDDSASWTQMKTSAGAAATITTAGVSTLWFDTDQLGTKFYNIRLKVEMATGSSTLSPKVVFGKIRHLREFDILFGFNAVLNLRGEQPDGRQPMEAIADLDALAGSKTLHKVAFQSGNSTTEFKLLILQYAGGPGDGPHWGGDMTLSMVQVLPT